MIASNSACTRSSSAQSRSTNSSLLPSAAFAGLVGIVGMTVTARSGVDGLPVLTFAGDGDLAGLGLLGDWDDLEGEHAAVFSRQLILGEALDTEHIDAHYDSPVAQQWLASAAASGNTRLGPELAELAALQAAHGRDALVAALPRAITFSR